MNAIAHASAVPVSGSKLDNRRILAALIDLAVVGVGAAAILSVAGVLGGSLSEIGLPLIGVCVAWALYYYFACESSGSGQTLGKRVMKLRVTRTDGKPVEMREVAVRTVLRVIDFLLVGLVVMRLTGERRARLGDLAADTMVVSADVPGAEPAVAAAVAPAVVAPVAEEAAVEELEEPAMPDLASASLKELAGDVASVAGTAPDEEHDEVEELEPEPAGEYQPIMGVNAEQVAEVVEAEQDEAEPVEAEVVDAEPVLDPAVGPIPAVSAPVVDSEAVELAPEPVMAAAPTPAAEPYVAAAPEPVVELAPEPVVEAAPEPVVEPVVEVAPEPVVEVAPEPVVEVAPEPVVEVAPEPVEFAPPPALHSVEPVPVEPVADDGPVVEVHSHDGPVPVPPPAEPVAEDEPEVTVKSVETISAMDLIMGDGDRDEPSPPASA